MHVWMYVHAVGSAFEQVVCEGHYQNLFVGQIRQLIWTSAPLSSSRCHSWIPDRIALVER